MKRIETCLWWLIPSLCILTAVEFTSRILITRFGNPLDQTRRVLWVDPYLGWRQREGLHTIFLGKALHTDNRGFRSAGPPQVRPYDVWMMGPSSTFGWGVDDSETYPALLGQEQKLSVLNGGQIGYSSYQGILLLEKLKSELPSPKLILFSYGINDLDRNRFYFQSKLSDRAELSRGDRTSTANALNFIISLSTTSLALKLRGTLPALLHARNSDFTPPSIRVPMEEVRANILSLAADAEKMGAKPVFLTTAFHLAHAPAPTSDRETYLNGKRYFEQGELTAAERVFGAITGGDFSNEAYLYLSAIATARGDDQAAERFRIAATSREPERILRDVALLNETIRQAARDAGAGVVEIRDLVGPDTDFVDPVHFSPSGNRKIARGIASVINSKLKKTDLTRNQ